MFILKSSKILFLSTENHEKHSKCLFFRAARTLDTEILLKNDLTEGRNIVLHCMGGKGRSGTIAAILLLEFGENHKNAIEIVRQNRKGAIETKEQEDFILSYKINN